MKRLIVSALRGLYRGLLPARAKNTLRLWVLFDERDKPPARIEEFSPEPVLVLAPHPDDEVIGCGGALRRHALAGAPVTVVVLTDGRRGDGDAADEGDPEAPGAPGPTRAQAELAQRRKQESRAAAEILGTAEPVFLDEPDGALEPTAELAARLAEIVERIRPAVVYLPSVLDAHEDHWTTSLAFDLCLERLGRAVTDGLCLRQYEVWTPLVANAVVDIGAVLDDKSRALACFESQMPNLDVVRLALGLAQYRSIHIGSIHDRSIHTGAGRGHAEAFYESTVPAWRELLARYRERR